MPTELEQLALQVAFVDPRHQAERAVGECVFCGKHDPVPVSLDDHYESCVWVRLRRHLIGTLMEMD